MVKILFVHNGRTPFVQLDLDQLPKAYSVTECYLRTRWVNPASVWRQVKTHDLVFGWFASWHTFLPVVFAKLLGKPSALVIGGYDVAMLPEIGYGHQRGGLKKWLSRGSMRSATRLLAISSFSSDEAQRNASIPQERMIILSLGVPDAFVRLPQSSRARLILTVGNVDLPNLRRKGHEPFVQTAALMPDADFVLVGAWKDEEAIEYLRSMATPNVFFAGRVDDQRLLDYYRKASVYVQPSLHEGFGLSVAEAMLAGCVPVVTRAGALPEVVGPCGEYVDSTEPHEIAKAIETALTYSESSRARIRERILEEFPTEKRRCALERIVTELTAKGLTTVDTESQPALLRAARPMSRSDFHQPFVSVVMPVRNEAEFIGRSLGAVLAQDYPHDRMKVFIADGMSTDGTRQVIEALTLQYPDIALTVSDNVGQIVATGLNHALAQAEGEVIIRVDGHTIIAADYIQECVAALRRSDADNVGGRMDAVGENRFGQAVALATSSPFGIGGGRFHYSDREQFVDTVYMGAWPREVFDRVGLFDEEMIRNQDDELNYRLRSHEGKILLSPRIRSQYYNRTSPRALWRQYFQYGCWKVRVMQKHPFQMRLRQFVPALFLIALMISSTSMSLAVGGRYLFGLVLGSYTAANLIASILVRKGKSWRVLPLLPITFATLHLAYGSGFLVGLARFWNCWGKDARQSTRSKEDCANVEQEGRKQTKRKYDPRNHTKRH